MSDHTIVVIRSLRPFLYSFSVYSCHFYLISFASVRLLPFLSFVVPILAWNIPLVSPIFLKRSLVFLILSFSSISLHVHWRRPSYISLLFSGTLHSVGHVFPFLPCLLGLFSSQLFVKPPQTTTLASCISFCFWMVLVTASYTCYEPLSIVLQVLCLSDRIPCLNLFITSTV